MAVKLLSIMVEDAIGHTPYENVVSVGWDDLKSSSYLKLVFANGHILLLNDFSIRKVFIRPMEEASIGN